MKGIGGRTARAALAMAAILPVLAGCWWLEPSLGPGEWGLRRGGFGDGQPSHVASLYESDGFGQLIMDCGGGPISFRIASGRDSDLQDLSGLPVRYRLDGNPPVATQVSSNRIYLWFRDPARATGEDPMVGQIAGARQLTVRIDWSPTDHQIMRFDVSRAAGAIDWLRRGCAD